MKCLVTGGAGFIGSTLVDKLIAEGNEVVVIDNESSKAHDQFYWNKNAIKYKYDICDYNKCQSIFKKHKPEIIFHLAAESNIQSSIDNPLKTINSNILGTANILELARKFNIKRVIYSSTSSAYGLKNKYPSFETMNTDCLNPYSVSKISGEELCKIYSKLYNLETIIFRYFNVYGERQPIDGQYAPVIGIFLQQFKNKQPLTIVGDGSQKRDFIHVSDVVDINVKAMGFNPSNCINDETHNVPYEWGQVYNVGTGKNYSILEIANMISKTFTYLPDRPGEIYISLARIDKIKQHFKWNPSIDLKDWIKAQLL